MWLYIRQYITYLVYVATIYMYTTLHISTGVRVYLAYDKLASANYDEIPIHRFHNNLRRMCLLGLY